MAVADLVTWTRQSFGKTISESSTPRYMKRCGYAFYKDREVSHFSLHCMNVGILRGPNLTSSGIHLSGKRYCAQMNTYLRFHMEILDKRLLGRRMKQTIYPVRSEWFLK
ncbi:hypothetical protein AVEN_25146-1 [Araneus ventricosus]|uniref:Uncharacterized protein n=1 Tax=Araneus ventricosus TaxID=182803 RepID=A0A4Y2IGU7_ARAVE|nr:hypothetical protein AVEN_25146-1 [Araneus ventricosus]